jgi:hypothetical protein
MAKTRVVINPAGIKAAREAAAYGLLNFGFAVESAVKRDAVVAGGNRSFMTGPKTKEGTPRIGGTLRRSYHTVCYLDGKRIGAGTAGAQDSGVDEKTPQDVAECGVPNTVPHYPPGSGIVVYVGSNSGYGAFVELGTSKMAARPTLMPALLRMKDQAPALIRAGVQRHMSGGSGRSHGSAEADIAAFDAMFEAAGYGK